MKRSTPKPLSQRQAIRHALTIQTLFPGEADSDYRELLTGLQAEYQPQTELERFEVEELAIAAWRVRRARAFETQLISEALERRDDRDQPHAVAYAWAESGSDIATRYETHQMNEFRSHLARLRELQNTRLRGQTARPAKRQKNQSFTF